MTINLRRPTRHELRELARLVSLWRSQHDGEAWDKPGVEDALVKADETHRVPFDELTRAALRAAADPANRTPAVIALDGGHWRAPTGPPRSPRVPTHDRCSVCGDPVATHWRTDHTPVRDVPTNRPAPAAVNDAVTNLRELATPPSVKEPA